ncbi:protein of unknown function [Mariniphaga anaerophila]|uniref:DUF4270 domain-containing protein n=1 Tax=Mariniphaga anaerophila TaxID=1484053 RepID=A0A1M4TL82_9BACT|nr:DUF4270 family protein [Mariniphaga anaerophila]SHE45124.1 protein of unknown function [Mariniphaga anaerophila]
MKLKTIFYGALVLLLSACGFENDLEDISMGKDFISSQVWLSLVDSFSVSMSTIALDSIQTSGQNVAWVGKYSDEELGVVEASSYFELEMPSGYDVDDDDRFDSLSLVLYYNGKYYGDTLSPQEIAIYRLAEEPDPTDNDDKVFYNTSSVKYENTPLGSLRFVPRPKGRDSIEIRLSDALGKDILKKMKNQDDTLTNSERFKEYFPGIAMVSGAENSAVVGFQVDSTLRVKLYTTRLGLENEDVENVILSTNYDYQFNRFSADRKGTPLEGIEPLEKFLSSKSDNKTFIQSGLGIFTRVDFPSLQVLLETDLNYDLYKVELVLFPEAGTYTNIPLPSDVSVYYTDKYNRILGEVEDDSGNYLTSSLQLDSIYHENTQYVFDITDFIKAELSSNYFDTDHGLLIGESSSAMGSSLNRAVFSSRKKSVFKPQLKLYFLFYNS